MNRVHSGDLAPHGSYTIQHQTLLFDTWPGSDKGKPKFNRYPEQQNQGLRETPSNADKKHG